MRRRCIDYWDLLRMIDDGSNPEEVRCANTLFKFEHGAYRDSNGVSIEFHIGAIIRDNGSSFGPPIWYAEEGEE